VWFEQVMFVVAGGLALAGALGVVVIRNPFYSVLSLITHLVALSILFLLLQAQFLAAAQVVVYAGAVTVLYVFVVAYIGGSDEPLRPEGGALNSFGPIFAGAVGVELCLAILGTGLGAVDSTGADVSPGFGTPAQIGSLLLRRFLVGFEAASYLLLVAAVGAVVLARRRRGLEEPAEDAPSQPSPVGAAAYRSRGGW
jgi:NADH-quinone oxidoreductase subunit J